MPHPRRTEELIDVVSEVAARVDDLVLEHVANGRRLPSESMVLDLIEPDVTEAVRVAFDDITATWTVEELDAATDVIMAELAVIVRRALRDAQSRRIEAESVAPDRLQDDDSVAGWVRAGAGLGALIAAAWAKKVRSGRRAPATLTGTVRSPVGSARGQGASVAAETVSTTGGTIPKASGPSVRTRPVLTPQEVKYLAAVSGEPAPRRTAWQVKQVLRTRIAEERNTVAANVADRAGLVIYVEDARKGPTDEECEDVNGRYATTLWLRRHRVSHPNCTRRGRPAVLPSGEAVTLLE